MTKKNNINWKDETIISRIRDLAGLGYSSSRIAESLEEELDINVNDRSIRRVANDNGIVLQKSNNNGFSDKSRVEEERREDGTLDRVQKIEMTEEEAMDDEFVLKAHGFDPKKWKIINVKNGYWDQGSADSGTKRLYSSKISVKPIDEGFDEESFINHLVEHKEPYKDKAVFTQNENGYLVIPAFDTHFNGATLPNYQKSLNKQIELIGSRDWKDILLILGGDIAHTDNVNSTTTRGTQLDTTNMEPMIDEMEQYFEPIITEAIQHSKHVQVIYAKGNHDISVGYVFARLLKRAYQNQQNIDFDIDLTQYKAYMLGNNFIGATHGNKGQKNYVANFASRFAVMWGSATNRELFTGHLHSELSKDLGGFIQRQVSTRKPTDNWTDDLGVVSTKNFELVVYNENETEEIHYV